MTIAKVAQGLLSGRASRADGYGWADVFPTLMTSPIISRPIDGPVASGASPRRKPAPRWQRPSTVGRTGTPMSEVIRGMLIPRSVTAQ